MYRLASRTSAIASTIFIAAATLGSGPVGPDASMFSSMPGFTDGWGTSVAFGDGFIAVGSPSDDDINPNAGTVSVIWYDPATGAPTMSTIVAPAGLSSNAAFGNVVAVSGNRMVVSAPAQDSGMGPVGAVYIYDVGLSVVTLTEMLNPSTLSVSDLFGWDVDIQDDWVVVGAPGSFGGAGSVWVFQNTGGDDWSSGQELFLPAADDGDGLGWAVALDQNDQNRFAASAPYVDVAATVDAGAIVIFEYDLSGGMWTPVDTLDQTMMPLGTVTTHLGNDLDFNDTTLIAGEFMNALGQAHIFEDGAAWAHATLLEPAGSANILKFGWSVTVHDDLAAVGAMHADFGLPLEGAAYLYHTDGAGTWNQIAELQSNGGSAGALGSSVSLAADGLIVGASGATEPAAGPVIGHGNAQYWSTSQTPGCPSDVNMDGQSDVNDISDLLLAWGTCGDPAGCVEDVNNDGAIDVLDLIDLLSNWGSCF
jgi:hypothetical protein